MTGHREVRRVPLDWSHPVKGGSRDDGQPRYRPLFSQGDLREHRTEYAADPQGREPDPGNYMPEFPGSATLGYQLYETTTEGTPVSPVLLSLEELAAWCEGGETVVAHHRWTREQWLASFRAGTLDVDSLLRGG